MASDRADYATALKAWLLLAEAEDAAAQTHVATTVLMFEWFIESHVRHRGPAAQPKAAPLADAYALANFLRCPRSP